MARKPHAFRAGMEYDRRGPALFTDFGAFNINQIMCGPSAPQFYGDRNGHGFDHFGNDFFKQRKITQQSGPAVFFYDLWDRTSGIQINEVRPEMLFDVCSGIGDMVGIGAENLDADRPFGCFKMNKTFRFFRAMKKPFGAHHFGHQNIRTMAPANPAENGFGNACHGRQEQLPVFEIQIKIRA
jgi:hypothetical protein